MWIPLHTEVLRELEALPFRPFWSGNGLPKSAVPTGRERSRGCSSSLESRGMHTVSRHVRDTGDRYRRFLAASEKNPVFAECNAIAPATARDVGALFEGSVCRYVDAGIIGGSG